MGRVLLLEDHHAFTYLFERVFEDRLDHCFNAGEVAARGGELGRTGQRWDYAFIDFELGDPRFTGFAALQYLLEESPKTKIVVFTAIGERGRTLFALAAREWFNAWTVLDKQAASDATLRKVAAGEDPAEQWQGWLAKSSVINGLFEKQSWLQLWRLWATYRGSQTAISKAGKVGPTPVREFGKGALKAIELLKHEVPSIDVKVRNAGAMMPHQRGNEATQVPLVEFYHTHSNFFNAPELPEILELVEPWNRIGR